MTWRQQFYDGHYAARFLEQCDPREVKFLLDILPAGRVLDQCCGLGRFSSALARHGLIPVGVDANPDYVEEAARRCPEGEFHCRDAADFVAAPACQGGFNFFSSFGYDSDDRENRRVLQAAFASLAGGAPFVLDTINFARLLHHFQPKLEQTFPDGARIQRLSHLDLVKGMLHQRWIYHLPDGQEQERTSQTRILLPREVADMLTASGFEVERMVGDVDGRSLDEHSPRLVVVARRP